MFCMYALADTLDPAAILRMRAALKDDDQLVRFSAACLLSRVNDASGMPELRAELARQRHGNIGRRTRCVS